MKYRIKKSVAYYLLTVLLFLFCLKILTLFDGKVYVWLYDGASQHLSALTYYSVYLREILNSIIHGDFALPRWDLAIGEGSDILTTLHYYCIGDPLALLSVFFPERYMYVCYEIIIYIRMILSGFSFMFFIKEFDNGSLRARTTDAALAAGAILYTFSGWVLEMSNRHPFFVMPMILLPLLLIGVERIIAGKRGFMMFAVLLCAVSNLYFFYISAALTVVYVAVRFLILYRRDVKTMMIKLAFVAAESVIGTVMGCAVFYPVAKVFLSDSRVGGGNLGILYPLTYYLTLPQALVSAYWSYYLFIGVGAIGVFAVYLAFARKGYTHIRAFAILAFVFLLFPVFGSVLNGFAYPSNRWAFAIPFVCSAALVATWKEFESLRKKDVICCVVIGAVLLAGSIYMKEKAGIIMSLTGIAVIIVLMAVKGGKYRRYILPASVVISQMTLMIIYNLGFIDQLAFAPWLNTYYFSNEAAYIAQLGDEGPVRYSGDILTENVSPLAQVSSTQFYWSNANPDVGEFRTDVGSPEYRLYYYTGYNASNILLNLAGCRYYAQSDVRENPIPYNYTPGDHIGVGYTIYTNDLPASLVYTYDNSVSESYWKTLTPVDRQVLIADTVVVPEEYADADSVQTDTTVIECTRGEDTEDGGVRLLFEGKPGSETYVVFNELKTDDVDQFVYLWVHIPETDEYYCLPYYTMSNWYNGREQFVLNLGWHEDAIHEVEIRSQDKIPYSCNFGIACIDMDKAEESLNERFNGTPSSIEVEDRGTRIAFGTDCTEDRYCVLAVPYSDKWTAKIDGEEVPVIRANIQYMTVKVPSGNHSVEFVYKGDYDAGMIISLAGIILAAGYIICGTIIRNKKLQEKI